MLPISRFQSGDPEIAGDLAVHSRKSNGGGRTTAPHLPSEIQISPQETREETCENTSLAGGILSTIGHTPLVRLTGVFEDCPFRLFAKVEGFNPGGSAKDRPALHILQEAMRTGAVKRGSVVIESSSGN